MESHGGASYETVTRINADIFIVLIEMTLNFYARVSDFFHINAPLFYSGLLKK